MVIFHSLDLPFIPSSGFVCNKMLCVSPKVCLQPAPLGPCKSSRLWVQDLLAAKAAPQRVGGPSTAGAWALTPRAPGVPQAVPVLLRACGPGALWGTRGWSVWVLSEWGNVRPKVWVVCVSVHAGLAEDEDGLRFSDSFQFNTVHMFRERDIWVQGPWAVTEKGKGLHLREWTEKGGQK